MNAGPLFWLYLVYFIATTAFAINNVLRARRRCLTAATHRRMTYLLIVFLTPLAGIFPYSMLFPNPAPPATGLLWGLIHLGSLRIVIIVAVMAYPISVLRHHT